MPGRIARAAVSRGFTLVEILVVLVIVGLTTGLVVPRLVDLPQRLQVANERKRLLARIEGLGYRAYTEGRGLTLREPARQPGAAAAETPLEIPEGWKLGVEAPIQYLANGACGGGVVAITSPRGDEERFRLLPPVCKPEPIEALRS